MVVLAVLRTERLQDEALRCQPGRRLEVLSNKHHPRDRRKDDVPSSTCDLATVDRTRRPSPNRAESPPPRRLPSPSELRRRRVQADAKPMTCRIRRTRVVRKRREAGRRSRAKHLPKCRADPAMWAHDINRGTAGGDKDAPEATRENRPSVPRGQVASSRFSSPTTRGTLDRSCADSARPATACKTVIRAP